MSLTPVEQVRMGIGDITLPYILSNSQIQHYITSNSDDISDAIDELQPILLSILASRGNANRTEDLWEDTTKQSDSYIRALEKANQLKARSAYPIIGGCTVEVSVGIDMFDAENDSESDEYYNGYEDI